MQKRVFEVSQSKDPAKLDTHWEKIRRGWVFGSDDFRREMQSAVKETMKGKRRDSFSGEMVNKHDEQEASRLLCLGLDVCGLKCSELETLKKGDDQKKIIAWLIQKNTSVKSRRLVLSIRANNEPKKPLFSGDHPAMPETIHQISLALTLVL